MHRLRLHASEKTSWVLMMLFLSFSLARAPPKNRAFLQGFLQPQANRVRQKSEFAPSQSEKSSVSCFPSFFLSFFVLP